MKSFDILLAGVGGQGIVLASRLLMDEAMRRGSEVHGAETHGMAQRGGSVVAHVRLGRCHSTLIIPGTAELLVGMERTEGLRNLRFLGQGGTFMVNTPDLGFLDSKVADFLERKGVRVSALNASKMAMDAGSPLSVNLIMLGFAAADPATPFDIEGLTDAAQRVLRPRFLKGGLAALQAGHQATASPR